MSSPAVALALALDTVARGSAKTRRALGGVQKRPAAPRSPRAGALRTLNPLCRA
jgi:hypothetical protein